MIDLGSECNFLKPNISINYEKLIDLKELNYTYLLDLLSKRYGVKKEQIELYNGYSSAIYSILKFLDSSYCCIYSPSNLEYKKAAKNLSYSVRLIDRFENIYLPVRYESVVIFMNPSFLDGTYYDLEKLFSYWVSQESVIIIDESVLDFCNQNSCCKFLNQYKNLYIIKDFSKYFSNATLNISSIFSNKENIEHLRRFEPSNKLSVFDVKYLEESLKDIKYSNISNSVNIKNRIEYEKIFLNSKFVDKIYQSSSNSLLIKLKENVKVNDLENISNKNGISFINCKEYDFLDERFINIYVNSIENVEVLKRVFNAV